MANASHTPGPWEVNGDYVTQEETGYHVARVFEDSAHPDPRYVEELPLEANARLIAAAPDLLEALQSAREAICAVLNETTDSELAIMLGDEMDKADAALAAVEGK